MSCLQASSHTPSIWKRALLDRQRQRMTHLVKKGSLTKCKTTGRLEVNGNSKNKVVKK